MNARPLISLATLAVLLLAGAAPLRAETPVSFAQQIVPVLRGQCAGCHMTGEEPGGMRLYPSAAWKTLVGTPATEAPLKRVEPGVPERSYLLHKLQGTHLKVGGSGVQMPFGQAPLPAETQATIRRWIEEGALDN
ncbi:hypothetical protein NG726_09340 [Pseudomonas sp. MOB-449]|nr:hypothetical protein [Pseudomonas sp. MOB-449]